MRCAQVGSDRLTFAEFGTCLGTRIALITVLTFLEVNGFAVEAPDRELGPDYQPVLRHRPGSARRANPSPRARSVKAPPRTEVLAHWRGSVRKPTPGLERGLLHYVLRPFEIRPTIAALIDW